ncbi:hypothetical protein FXO37_29714 [Capsicum annuum]|nr:hypothetical protein FXO37_29714 [Capsicum annuum]
MGSKGGRKQRIFWRSSELEILNFNKSGRYISLTNVRGRRRSVIIIPELNFNSGWEFIAEKIIAEKMGRFQKVEENRNTAEDVIAGDWTRNEIFHQLEWWSPTSGTVEERDGPTPTWTRFVGLPLHLWSDTVFTAIENLCGGWIETEEETKLRNHLNRKKFMCKEMVRESLRRCP